MTRVSVIMPAYNAEEFIAEAIDSVIAQTFQDWELIVVDDGSTDGTANIVKTHCSNDKRIQYYYQKNGKQAKARNLGIVKAKGKLIAFLDADDYWMPEKLYAQIFIFDQNPHPSLVFTNGFAIKGVDQTSVDKLYHLPEGLITPNAGLVDILQNNFVLNSSVIVKRTALDRVGLLTEDINYQNAEDYDLWIRFLENDCSFYFIDKTLTGYRHHPAQSTADDYYASYQILHILSSKTYYKHSLQRELIRSAKRHFSRLVRKHRGTDYSEIIRYIDLYSKIRKSFMIQYGYLVILFFFRKRLFATFAHRFISK